MSAKHDRGQSTSGEPILLIYWYDLSYPDGASDQLGRMLGSVGRPVIHVMGSAPEPGSEGRGLPGVVRICLPQEIKWPFWRGARTALRFYRRWIWPAIARRRLRRLAPDLPGKCPSAYVVVYDEVQAHFARRVIMDARPRSYVLHIMDWFSRTGVLDPENHNLRWLVRGAAQVRVVSKRMADELSGLRKGPVEIPGFFLISAPAKEPVSSGSQTMLTGGAIYHKDDFFMRDFLPAWRTFAAGNPRARLAYVGSSYSHFSGEARRHVENLGRFEREVYFERLRTFRFALVPIRHSPDDCSRYQVITRAWDYLRAGLPVLAGRSEGTATNDFFKQFEGRGVLLARDQAELLVLLNRLFLDDAFHRQQSVMALEAAASLPSNEAMLRRLKECISEAEAAPAGPRDAEGVPDW